MKIILALAATITSLALAAPASADGPDCTTTTSTHTESREMGGQVAGSTIYGPVHRRVTHRHHHRHVTAWRLVTRYVYGMTPDTRTVTDTTTTCPDGTTTETSATPWEGAYVVRLQTRETVRP